VHIRRIRRKNQQYALIVPLLYFYVLAPTCFGSSLPSSGSLLDPPELLENTNWGLVYTNPQWEPTRKNKGVLQSVLIVGFSSNNLISILHLYIGSQIYMSMYPRFVTHLPEDGHMRGRNMYAVYGVYNTLSYTCVHLLVLIPHPGALFNSDTVIYLNRRIHLPLYIVTCQQTGILYKHCLWRLNGTSWAGDQHVPHMFTNTENTQHVQPCLQWDSNALSQCSNVRRLAAAVTNTVAAIRAIWKLAMYMKNTIPLEPEYLGRQRIVYMLRAGPVRNRAWFDSQQWQEFYLLSETSSFWAPTSLLFNGY
jgi:hypothetical protein